MRTTLTYRPIVPGSDQHLALLERAGLSHHGRILYPDLHERRVRDAHRRASAVIAAAAARVRTKQDPARSSNRAGSPPPTAVDGRDGCKTECA
jgi:hypothetical protein